MNIRKGLRRFAGNLKYLCSHDLGNDEFRSELIYCTIRHTEELEMTKMVFRQDASFKILNDEETWEKILTVTESFLRIGDGELALINGQSIEFQKYDKRLAEYLQRILSGDRTDLYIGIDCNYFHGFDNVTETIRKHNYLWGPEYKKILVRYCNPDREYISSSFNQLYIDYIKYDWNKYLTNIRELFQSRDIVVFAGEGIFDGLQYNLFENAHSCEYVWAPAKNAFDQFDDLLRRAREFSRDKVLCFVLGPTSKPLVYELSKEGYTAWDLGHMAKDYDCCCRRSAKNARDVMDFFAPDGS